MVGSLWGCCNWARIVGDRNESTWERKGLIKGRKTAEGSQGQGLRQGWEWPGRMLKPSWPGRSLKGLRTSFWGQRECCRRIAQGWSSQFYHCCFQNTQQKQLRGWRGFISLRVSGDLVHPSKDNQVDSTTQYIARGSRKQNRECLSSTGLGFLTSGEELPTFRAILCRQLILSGNSQIHPEMQLTNLPMILAPGKLIMIITRRLKFGKLDFLILRMELSKAFHRLFQNSVGTKQAAQVVTLPPHILADWEAHWVDSATFPIKASLSEEDN